MSLVIITFVYFITVQLSQFFVLILVLVYENNTKRWLNSDLCRLFGCFVHQWTRHVHEDYLSSLSILHATVESAKPMDSFYCCVGLVLICYWYVWSQLQISLVRSSVLGYIHFIIQFCDNTYRSLFSLSLWIRLLYISQTVNKVICCWQIAQCLLESGVFLYDFSSYYIWVVVYWTRAIRAWTLFKQIHKMPVDGIKWTSPGFLHKCLLLTLKYNYYNLYRVAQKVSRKLLSISSSNIEWFSKFLHLHILWKICIKVVTKYTTTP